MFSFPTSLCYYHPNALPGNSTFTRKDDCLTPFENIPVAQLPQSSNVKTLIIEQQVPSKLIPCYKLNSVILFHISRRGRWFKSYVWVISRTQFSTDECKQYVLKTWFLWHVSILMVVYHQNSKDTLNLVHVIYWPRPRYSELTTFLGIPILASAASFHLLLQGWQIFIIFSYSRFIIPSLIYVFPQQLHQNTLLQRISWTFF